MSKYYIKPKVTYVVVQSDNDTIIAECILEHEAIYIAESLQIAPEKKEDKITPH